MDQVMESGLETSTSFISNTGRDRARSVKIRMRGLIAVVVLVIAAGCSPSSPPASSPATSTYLILSSSVDPNKGACCNHIVGEVKNNSTKEGRSVRVVATLYDDTGRVVGTESDLVSGATQLRLAPGETVPFSIMVEKTTVFATYKLQVSAAQ